MLANINAGYLLSLALLLSPLSVLAAPDGYYDTKTPPASICTTAVVFTTIPKPFTTAVPSIILSSKSVVTNLTVITSTTVVNNVTNVIPKTITIEVTTVIPKVIVTSITAITPTTITKPVTAITPSTSICIVTITTLIPSVGTTYSVSKIVSTSCKTTTTKPPPPKTTTKYVYGGY
ncbi:MAG: hypothetical protein M1839_001425 [Geoglossum umbratile]|nr:MAG: hypothetical protein M1839_001425 [Geoglossum umbratile]